MHYRYPLILLPLIENSFKHGTADSTGMTIVNISLNITGISLELRLNNSHANTQHPAGNDKKSGLGEQNVKRLAQSRSNPVR